MSFQKKWEKICEQVSNLDDHASIMDWGDLLRAIEAVGNAVDTPAWFSSIQQYFDKNIGDILTDQQSASTVLPGLKEFCEQLNLIQKNIRAEAFIKKFVLTFSNKEQPNNRESAVFPQKPEKTPPEKHPEHPGVDEQNVLQHLPPEAWTDNLYSDFINEAEDMLEETDQVLNIIQQSGASDQTAVNTLFRTMHTIKGTAGFLGLIDISVLAHHTEDLLVKIRDGQQFFSADNILGFSKKTSVELC
ncbi:MAG: Hpt domain-containing protein [SAR324 cluster bacterium]|nr:Hpt domain-containing protein [SAR324 cluster bacterium]